MSQHAAAGLNEADEALTTYVDAVALGHYDTHIGNLAGKHDNVRSYWEDQLTRLTLRPYLTELVERKHDQFGSLSHLTADSLASLLGNIANHAANHSLVVMDLLGRNSLEWPEHWHVEADVEPYADYTMSYLYRDLDNQIDPNIQVEHFPMRYWGGEEIDQCPLVHHTVRFFAQGSSLKLVHKESEDKWP